MDMTKAPGVDAMIENRTFSEIAIGDSASVTHTLTKQDIELFAIVSGDVNPTHLDPTFADTDPTKWSPTGCGAAH
jgi:acyl dehydratase